MRQIATLFSVAVALFAAFSPAAMAWSIHGSIAVAASCANLASFSDEQCPTGGGSGATDGNFINPTLFTAAATNYVYSPGVARENNQPSYTKLPPYDVAGVTFRVGYSQGAIAAQGGFKDPSTINGTQTGLSGCSYSASGSRNGTSGAWVRCSGPGGASPPALDIEGYDFGTGPHGCVYLEIGSGYSSKTVKNNKIVNGAGCSSTATKGSGAWGVGFLGYITSAGLLCVGPIQSGTDGIVVGDKIVSEGSTADDPNTRLGVSGLPFTITASGGGTCPSGGGNTYTAYTINKTGYTYGTSTAPVLLGEATPTLTLTTTSGTLASGQQIQGVLDGTGGGTDTVNTCTPACGGPGTYTIQAYSYGSPVSAYSPPEAYITGNSVSALVNIIHGDSVPVYFVQNYVDGSVGCPTCEYVDPTTSLTMDNAVALYASTQLYVVHNAFLRMSGKVFAANPLSMYVYGNYIEGFGNNKAEPHMEIAVTGPDYGTGTGGSAAPMQDMQYVNNTVITTVMTPTHNGTAPIWLSASNWSTGDPNGGELTAKYNTTITNGGNPASDDIDGTGSIMSAASFEVQTPWTTGTVSNNYMDPGIGGKTNNTTINFCFYSTGGGNASNTWLSNNYNMANGHLQSQWGVGGCQ